MVLLEDAVIIFFLESNSFIRWQFLEGRSDSFCSPWDLDWTCYVQVLNQCLLDKRYIRNVYHQAVQTHWLSTSPYFSPNLSKKEEKPNENSLAPKCRNQMQYSSALSFLLKLVSVSQDELHPGTFCCCTFFRKYVSENYSQI